MRVIGMVSARASAGKTTIAVNLAESIAQAGESVVLIDGDMRLPAVHEAFGLPNDRGLSSVLLGDCALSEALAETDVPRLRVLTSGPCPEDPPVLLGLPSMREMIAELRRTVGWVIVDTPAGLAHVDGIVASVELDAVLMVIAAGEVARGAEDRLVSDLEAVGTQVVGVVVNRVLPQHADTIYHYQQYYARSRAANDAR
jgi:capsular exopolysaccharide synthesis family protein